MTAKKAAKSAKPKLLSGGNPQIAKGDGIAPVQAYIEAMPGWKRDVGRALDALITGAIPGVRKAVKWNTPFYGAGSGSISGAKPRKLVPDPLPAKGWFMAFHCTSKYVKVAFFKGAALEPMPPVESKQKDVRYFHIHEHDKLDKAQLKKWIKQAAAQPGWMA
ncbi:MAG: DUF1801 domain-containing protein [Planctomycetes bacterium]|nr:DUF1801 domain-containing protein [Planctomycetota bacterium]